ncbi:hypothetical protein B0A53_03679 [Rhodotorula sp. CCFEE 5036]|nr:hypothetical protein B0A53_03679 [Rhodotorula sp. CCFEE 5036]
MELLLIPAAFQPIWYSGPLLSFRIVCQSCEPHEDSASGCLIQSVFTDRCVELVLPGSANPPSPGRGSNNPDEVYDAGSVVRPHLGWADCSLDNSNGGGGGGGRDKLPWTRSGKRDQPDAARKLERQLWDIAP